VGLIPLRRKYARGQQQNQKRDSCWVARGPAQNHLD
jgi:hypothetical protein